MNVFDMSDEELSKMSDVPESVTSAGDVVVDKDTDNEEEITEVTPPVTEQNEVTETADNTEEDTDSEDDEGNTEEEDTNSTTEPDEATRAKELMEKIYSPIKANGKEIKIDNPDDAVRLMQMGLGYNKKMATLKPHLKLIKMLGNNDLLDEAKLSHLIDISKKNPGAISKLLAESNIDPLNLPTGNEYTPNTYTVNDSELELDNVLSDLKESPHYGSTLNLVVNEWDETSKKILVSNPAVIRTLHEHMSNGVYAQVSSYAEKERAMGRLQGMSDLEAYKAAGDEMAAKGMFAPQSKPATSQAKVRNEAELKSRKLATSPTKSAPSKGKASPLDGFDPLKATDEEIANMSIDKFI